MSTGTPRSPRRPQAFAAGLAITVAWGAIALADAPPPRVRCPEKPSCAELGAKIAVHRRKFQELKERLEDQGSKEPIPDEAILQQDLTDLRNLSSCRRCARGLRSEAYMVQAGVEGLLVKYYDSWGVKKGEDGRRSFRSTREAARVDPDNLAAWTAYGKALVAIEKQVFKDRIAGYLEIDLVLEMKTVAAGLHRMLSGNPRHPGGAREVLAALEPLIQ